MVKKIANLDNDPSLEVVDLQHIIRLTGMPWNVRSMMEEWVKDPKIPTPEPAIKINGEPHWVATDENKEKFMELLKIHDWLKAEREQRELGSVAVQADWIVDMLILKAHHIERQNSRCYKNNRGNSLQDGRRRIYELEGAIDFVKGILSANDLKIPEAKSRKVRNLLSKAQEHVA